MTVYLYLIPYVTSQTLLSEDSLTSSTNKSLEAGSYSNVVRPFIVDYMYIVSIVFENHPGKHFHVITKCSTPLGTLFAQRILLLLLGATTADHPLHTFVSSVFHPQTLLSKDDLNDCIRIC